jgi:uncharacterized membrane protein
VIVLIALFLLHAAATLFMTGLIWFVQVVHYPLFACVGAEQYRMYQTRHMTLTTWVVGPAMLIEGVTAIALVWQRPNFMSSTMAWAGLALVVVLALSTAMLQVPQHEKLANGFDAEAHKGLVRSNWLRTTIWSVRSGMVFYVAWLGLFGAG